MNVLYIKKVRLKDKSTLSKFLYVILHIWVGGFIGIWYFFWLSLFTSVPSSLYDDAPVWLFGCMVLVCSIGIAVTFSARRTCSNVICNIAAGCGLYVIFQLGCYSVATLIAIMVAAAICSGVGIVRICLRHTGARTVSRQRLAMARRIRVRDLIRRNACIACGVCAILIPLAVGHTDWMKLYEIYCNQMNRSMGSNADFDYAATNYYEDHGIEKNFDTIKRIYDNDEWQSLATEQKKETVKAIFDCESKYLGVQNAVSLEFSDNLPSSLYYEVRAQYDSNNRKITIKDGLLDYDNDEVFMVIAEEVYHAYEHDMMELYSQTLTESQKSLWCFKDVGAWIKNNDSYVIGGNSSYEAYESQPIEEAAKEYATYSWVSYMQNIGDVVDVCYTDENSD